MPVAEYSLALSLLLHPSRTFVGDVFKPESFPYINPLFWVPNAILTPHIAGSTGSEPRRMAYYMMEEMRSFISGAPTRYEVTLEALERMALGCDYLKQTIKIKGTDFLSVPFLHLKFISDEDK